MKPAKRSRVGWLVLVGLLIAVLGLGLLRPQLARSLGAFFGYRWSLDYPKNTNKEVALKGLSAPVRVHFDPYGIPHIEAKNDLDLVRVVGYVQARDRFFQMDVLRRVAQGRLSELLGNRAFLGSSTVTFDRTMRGWDFSTIARKTYAQIKPAEKRMLQAFVAGVNAARTTFHHAEYRILGVDSEAFTAIDAFSIGLLNAWSISHNWQQELVRLLLALYLGVDKAAALYPHAPLSQGVSMKLDGQHDYPLRKAIAPVLRAMFERPLLKIQPPRPRKAKAPHPRKAPKKSAQLLRSLTTAVASIAFGGNSNAWVVGGERATGGKPILSNDPHLTHFVPSMLYQQHLRTPDLDVIGVTMPGLPYVLIGQNRHLVWGMTSAVADAMDLVIERKHPTRKDRVYVEQGSCVLEHRKIAIKARSKKGFVTHRFTLRRTCHGPLLNDMYPKLLPPGSPMVAVQWYLDNISLSKWGKINRARSVKQLYGLLGQLITPVSTVQAADTQGNIGLFWAGTVPVRAHLGTFPYPGWARRYQWAGMVRHTDIPFGYNPKKGYFAHGNNLLVPPQKSPHALQTDSAPPYRVQRISKLLEATPGHTLDSFEKIQRDVKILRAQRVLPFILKDLAGMKGLSATAAAARKALQSWDLHARPGSVGACVFFQTYRYALLAAMKGKLPPEAFRFFMTQRYTTNVTDGWFTKSDHEAWDRPKTKAREGRAQIVRRAFLKAVEIMRANQGDQPKMWRWGKLHALQFRHPFGGAPLIGGFFNLPSKEGMGALESVWKSHFNLGQSEQPFRTVAGPVYRMLVDLSKPHRSRWVLDTGASGWPGSPHYADQFRKWYKGETVPMYFDWKEILSKAKGTWLFQ